MVSFLSKRETLALSWIFSKLGLAYNIFPFFWVKTKPARGIPVAGEMVIMVAGCLIQAISVIWGLNRCFGNNRAAILIVLGADQVRLKQKATGMGTPVAINSRLNRNYAAKWRRAHTDCSETTTDANFIIKQRASFFLKYF